MKTKRINERTDLQPDAQHWRRGPQRKREDIVHLKMFLRHRCPACSESVVAEEVRQLHHVQRVQAHPERHEIEIWTRFPAQGLMREIVGALKLFCCELTACHVR